MIIHQAFSPGKGVKKTSGTYIVDFTGDPAAILMNDFDRIFRKQGVLHAGDFKVMCDIASCLVKLHAGEMEPDVHPLGDRFIDLHLEDPAEFRLTQED